MSDNFNSTFLFEVFSEKWGNRYYELRPGIGLEIYGGINVKDRMLDSPHETLVSIPLYCKMAGISVGEVEYETTFIRVKPEYSYIDFHKKEFLKTFLDQQNDFDFAPSEDLLPSDRKNFGSWILSDKDHFDDKAKGLDKIFSAIITLSMSLCLFSLSSSMSANIFD